jgi:type I restriction enzyme M protein
MDCNLHTIVRLPNGVFAPYTGIKTNLLFFEKGKPTKDVWYFEHPYPEGVKNYNKTKPINIKEFELEKKWWKKRVENEYAWKVNITEIKKRNYNLDIKNPTMQETEEIISKDQILSSLKKNQMRINQLLEEF